MGYCWASINMMMTTFAAARFTLLKSLTYVQKYYERLLQMGVENRVHTQVAAEIFVAGACDGQRHGRVIMALLHIP